MSSSLLFVLWLDLGEPETFFHDFLALPSLNCSEKGKNFEEDNDAVDPLRFSILKESLSGEKSISRL
jgi:hypothetical protein